MLIDDYLATAFWKLIVIASFWALYFLELGRYSVPVARDTALDLWDGIRERHLRLVSRLRFGKRIE